MKQYDHKRIEQKWQKRWSEEKLYETPDTKKGAENYYMLVEFVYPSGNLHLGHWYAFSVPDIFVRKKRMEGKNVLFPMGFDSFGLPAENAAIKRELDPRDWTEENIAKMREQLESMGNAFDWSRAVTTSNSDYYKWTQWLFLKLYEKGLAYRGKAEVNWCPSCKTVLANEQVIDDRCERCDTEVEKRELEQWFFKITDYADRLLEDLKELDWPEEIKEAQRNWIGRSEGSLLSFALAQTNADSTQTNADKQLGTVEVFTTRPDTLFGATYLVLSPEHREIANYKSQITNWNEVEKYMEECVVNKIKNSASVPHSSASVLRSDEKTGVELKGIRAINPATKEEIPIWVADYVLRSVGTGAIMAVPSHDRRDWEFADKYGIEKREVVQPMSEKSQITNPKLQTNSKFKIQNSKHGAYEGGGVLVNSGEFDGMESEEAKKKITEYVGGEMTATYRLRDWLISRQRYWGAPIPIVYDPEGNAHPVPEEHLPWTLPEDVDFTPTGEAPLARSKELVERTERIFGEGWRPEVDTMDTFVDSSWYFLRYLDPKNENEFSAKDKQKLWMPVERYSGGAEHTTMHVLYSRFFQHTLYDMGLVTEKEPYKVRMNRGLVLGPDGHKMSKSRGNVIDPDENVERVGADTVKMYLAFIGPYNEAGSYPWDVGGIVGVKRFLEKAWRLRHGIKNQESRIKNDTLETALQKVIKKVTEDVEAFKFNTAISALMTFVNTAEKEGISEEQYKTFLVLLAPFAPHMTEELWREELGNDSSIHTEPWPEYDEEKIKENTVTIVVQVNGKVRGEFETAANADKKEITEKAASLPTVEGWIKGREIKNVIYVPQKLINIVVL